MNLSNILGQVTDVARTYYDIRNIRNNPYRNAPPIMATPVDYQVGPYGGNIIGGRMGRISPGGIIGGAVGGTVVDMLGNLFDGDSGMQLPEGV